MEGIFLFFLDFLDGLDDLDFLDILGILSGEFLDFFSKEGVLAAELGYFGLELLNEFFLIGAVAEACGGHALADASFGDELFFFFLLVGAEHFVYHMAKGDGSVGHFFIAPLLEVGLVVLQVVVSAAEGNKGFEAGMYLVPLCEMMAYEVVFVVFEQLLYAGTSYIE